MNKSSSWALIDKNGKFLFIERSEATSRPGQWCPPGGGRKENETPEEACIREVKEEVGISVVVESLIRKDESFYYYLCKPKDEIFEIDLKLNECKSYRWISLPDILELGVIMELKRMVRVFADMGYIIEVPDEA